MHISEIHHINGRPLLNGLLAVGKKELSTDSEGKSFEVCRLIMNLVQRTAAVAAWWEIHRPYLVQLGCHPLFLKTTSCWLPPRRKYAAFSIYSERQPHGGAIWPLEGRFRTMLSQKVAKAEGGTWSPKCCRWVLWLSPSTSTARSTRR